MNLIIDVGNTYTKIAIFDADKLIDKYVVHDSQSKERLSIILDNYPKLSYGIISVVGKWNLELQNYLKHYFPILILDAATKLPFENCYETPKTLGIDRLALASACVKQFPNTNTLVIDAGTCITYDFVTNNKKYLGGAISLGVQSRYKALHQFTEKLPLLEPKENVNVIGNTTQSAIHSGVVKGVVFEIEGVIQYYKTQFSDLTVVLTGGDSNFLAKQLKSTIFANLNFLLEGLNYILEYNKIND